MAVRTVVLDANIYVSALAFGGKPKRAFQLGIKRRVDVAISNPIRAEVLRTLRDKFRWSEERLTEASALIGSAATTVVPTVTLHAVERDPGYSAAWRALGKALEAAAQPDDALQAYRSGIAAAQKKGDKQAEKEMTVFARRIEKRIAG